MRVKVHFGGRGIKKIIRGSELDQSTSYSCMEITISTNKKKK
jgi:hypothetical protein